MTGLVHSLRAVPTIARISVAAHVAYRAEMVIWILTATLPLIMLALWNAVLGEGTIAGFGQAEVWRYFVATMICRQLTGAWVIYELSFSIRMGNLSTQLMRPYHPIVRYAVWMWTTMPFRMAILAPLVGLLVWIRPEAFVLPSLGHALLFVPSILLAWLLSFLIQCLFGLLSFWLDKSDGLFEAYQAVWAVVSGYVAPLAFFPSFWQDLLRWLPFYGTIAAPVELLAGFRTVEESALDVAVQAGWVVVAMVAVAWMWRRGLRRYGAFGA